MSIFIAVFMAIAVNLDNFMIGIQLGIQSKSISRRANIIISVITALIAAAAAWAPQLFPQMMIRAANITGAMIILIYGLYCLFHTEPKNHSVLPDELTSKGCILLGLTLSVNCIPPALGAGILHISALTIGLLCGICSFLCMDISARLGMRLKELPILSDLDKVSALLLICIGFLELLIQ